MTASFDNEERPGAVVRLGGAIAAAALRPAIGTISVGVRLARHGRDAIGHRLEGAALSGLDAAMASRVAEEAVDRAMASGLAERALNRALAGPLVDAVAADLVRYAVVERVTERLLADGIVEQTVGRVLEGPELERLVAAVLESPTVPRVLGQAIDSRLTDEVVARMVDSEDLWLIVEEIAQSPAVTDAISRQSMSFADQVADGVRARSRNADARLEHAARKALSALPRGRTRTGQPPGAAP